MITFMMKIFKVLETFKNFKIQISLIERRVIKRLLECGWIHHSFFLLYHFLDDNFLLLVSHFAIGINSVTESLLLSQSVRIIDHLISLILPSE